MSLYPLKHCLRVPENFALAVCLYIHRKGGKVNIHKGVFYLPGWFYDDIENVLMYFNTYITQWHNAKLDMANIIPSSNYIIAMYMCLCLVPCLYHAHVSLSAVKETACVKLVL